MLRKSGGCFIPKGSILLVFQRLLLNVKDRFFDVFWHHFFKGMYFVILVPKLIAMYTYITLKQLRELRNLTQIYVATKVGVTQSAYSKIENFDCQTSIENYEKIALILNVDVDQVISNRIQALIHIKSSSHNEIVSHVNIPKLSAIINSIKEQEFKLNKLLHSYSLKHS